MTATSSQSGRGLLRLTGRARARRRGACRTRPVGRSRHRAGDAAVLHARGARSARARVGGAGAVAARSGTASNAATLVSWQRADTAGARRVLLTHGWAGDAQQMRALGEALAAAGFDPVLLDLPAHGASDGARATLPQWVRALFTASAALGPWYGVVAHSLGALAVAHASARGLSAATPGAVGAVATAGAVSALVCGRAWLERVAGRAHGARDRAPRGGRRGAVRTRLAGPARDAAHAGAARRRRPHGAAGRRPRAGRRAA